MLPGIAFVGQEKMVLGRQKQTAEASGKKKSYS